MISNLMIFSEVRPLFVPGFWVAASANAAVLAVGYAYLSELFPTELRATLTSVVVAQIAGGSIGLLVIGALAATIDTSLQLVVGGCRPPVILLLRGYPRRVGRMSSRPRVRPRPEPAERRGHRSATPVRKRACPRSAAPAPDPSR